MFKSFYFHSFDWVRREYQTHVDSGDITISMSKHYPSDFVERYGNRLDLATHYASTALVKSRSLALLHPDTKIEIPTRLHFVDKELCQDAPFSLLTAVYSGLGPMAQTFRNPT